MGRVSGLRRVKKGEKGCNDDEGRGIGSQGNGRRGEGEGRWVRKRQG